MLIVTIVQNHHNLGINTCSILVIHHILGK